MTQARDELIKNCKSFLNKLRYLSMATHSDDMYVLLDGKQWREIYFELRKDLTISLEKFENEIKTNE